MSPHAHHREDLLEYFENRFMRNPDLEPGKMMGHPGFKIAMNGKFFCFLYEDGLTLKLPQKTYEEALQRDDVVPFQPMGDKKPMSTWIVWTLTEPSDYDQDWYLIDEAIAFTSTEPPNSKKKRPRKKWISFNLRG